MGYQFYICSCVHGPVSEHHQCADAQKREAEESMASSELKLQVVVHHLVCLRTELRFSGTTGSAVNHCAVSPTPTTTTATTTSTKNQNLYLQAFGK